MAPTSMSMGKNGEAESLSLAGPGTPSRLMDQLALPRSPGHREKPGVGSA